MLLRYLEKAVVYKATKTKQPNGRYTEELQRVKSFTVQQQELDDEISASVYGANIHKMLRIKSVRNTIEDYLYPKVNNEQDNISNYYVFIKSRKYKIVSVNSKGVDLELV